MLGKDNNMNKGLRFSVAMSIYKNDDPGYLRTAIRSTYEQTLPPAELDVNDCEGCLGFVSSLNVTH